MEVTGRGGGGGARASTCIYTSLPTTESCWLRPTSARWGAHKTTQATQLHASTRKHSHSQTRARARVHTHVHTPAVAGVGVPQLGARDDGGDGVGHVANGRRADRDAVVQRGHNVDGAAVAGGDDGHAVRGRLDEGQAKGLLRGVEGVEGGSGSRRAARAVGVRTSARSFGGGKGRGTERLRAGGQVVGPMRSRLTARHILPKTLLPLSNIRPSPLNAETRPGEPRPRPPRPPPPGVRKPSCRSHDPRMLQSLTPCPLVPTPTHLQRNVDKDAARRRRQVVDVGYVGLGGHGPRARKCDVSVRCWWGKGRGTGIGLCRNTGGWQLCVCPGQPLPEPRPGKEALPLAAAAREQTGKHKPPGPPAPAPPPPPPPQGAAAPPLSLWTLPTLRPTTSTGRPTYRRPPHLRVALGVCH